MVVELIFMLVMLSIPILLLWALVLGPKYYQRKILRDYPVGTKVRILAEPYPNSRLTHLIGTTAEVTGHELYDFIESRIKLNVELVPNYHRRWNIGFKRHQIEKVPELHLITDVELRNNYTID